MPRVINDGIGIHYRVEGDGPPLVLQHGFTDSSETWYERGYVDALKSRNRLILIDSRGHAGSDKPHDPASYTAAKYASDVTTVIDDLGISKTRYWGYSQGGWIGFALARYAPSSISALSSVALSPAQRQHSPVLREKRMCCSQHCGEDRMNC
jgi:pimeloyl-ACP methyl ester carboxylesterase